MGAPLTDQQLELELKAALEEKRPLIELAPLLREALSAKSKSKRLTATRFLQLHPEWSHWKDEFEPWLRGQNHWPWSLLISWLTPQRLTLTLAERERLKKALIQHKTMPELAKHAVWSVIFTEMSEWRSHARFDLQRKILEIRDLLFEELNTWKSQRLREQEQKVLQRLRKKFPKDPDIQREWNSFRENQAFETLHERLRDRRNRTPTLKFEDEITELPPLWREELQQKAEQDPSLFYDFALMCCFCEDWVWALHMINQADPSQARDWLELEILLKLKRYVDVLQALVVIETRWAGEAETFFATAYIRAQAFYGLGQKQKAFEVLESLLASRPLYRQGVELLNLWRGPV